MPANKGSARYHPDMLRAILNALVLKPRLKAVARDLKLHPTSLFNYLSRSAKGEPDFLIEWMGVTRQFADHVQIARKLSIVALDHSARDQAINGWEEPLYHDGNPVYKKDPEIAADAMSLSDEDWELMHGKRKRSDTFARTPEGALIHDSKFHPPNPALLVKLLSSLAPDQYGERSEMTITHQGHVWIEGQQHHGNISSRPQDDNFNAAFALAHNQTDAPRRTANTLAIPAPVKSTAEFDKRFLKKLLREPVIFRDEQGNVAPPLADDVIVRDSWQDKAFTEAGIVHDTVTKEELIAQGFKNDFLFADAQRTPDGEPAAEQSAENVLQDPMAAAYAALDRMPEGKGKEDMRAQLDKIREGKINSLPKDAHGNRTIPNIQTSYADDMPDDGPLQKPPVVRAQPGKPQQGFGDGVERTGAGTVAPGGYKRA